MTQIIITLPNPYFESFEIKLSGKGNYYAILTLKNEKYSKGLKTLLRKNNSISYYKINFQKGEPEKADIIFRDPKPRKIGYLEFLIKKNKKIKTRIQHSKHVLIVGYNSFFRNKIHCSEYLIEPYVNHVTKLIQERELMNYYK